MKSFIIFNVEVTKHWPVLFFCSHLKLIVISLKLKNVILNCYLQIQVLLLKDDNGQKKGILYELRLTLP